MGKDKGGFLAPKQIANRIKARGLQKLRWFCQMCNKQCRDENGFKCHCQSESHQRQMLIFSENSTKFMDEFSKEFEDGMMEIIQRKARSQRQNANQMYKDYIANKQHFHMNATIWETLTDFIMYLGRTGKCDVDETEKGWFVTYIDRDPETLARLEARAKRERTELDSEEKHQRDIQRMVKAARRGADDAPEYTELRREAGDKVSLGGGLGGKPKVAPTAACGFSSEDKGAGGSPGGAGGSRRKKPLSGIEKLVLEGKAAKEKAEAREREAAAREAADAADAAAAEAEPRSWLAVGVIVKIVNKRLADGKYYEQKGVVERVVDGYTAHVRMASSGDLISLDLENLETVIPAVGGRVLLVGGKWRGQCAELRSIDETNFCVSVRLEGGAFDGKRVERVEYEEVCKLA